MDPSASGTPPPAAPGWRLTLLLIFLIFMPLMGVDLSLPGNPLMAKMLNTSVANAQLGLALFAGAFGFMHLIYGPLADRFGRRPFVLFSLVAMIVASALCALAPNIEVLLVGRFLQGVGAAAGPLLARAIIRDLWGVAGSGRMMGYVMAAFGVAAASLPIIAGQLTEHLGWRAPFWFGAGYAAVMLAATLPLLPETRPASSPDRINIGRLLGSYRTLMTDVRFILVAVCGTMVACGMFQWIAGSTFVVQTVLGYSPGEYSLIYAVTVGAFVAFSMLSGRLAARVGSYRLLTIGLCIAATGGVLCLIAGLSLTVTLYVLLPPLLIMILGHGFTLPQSMAASIAPFPHLAATASALYGFFQYGFNGILTWLQGLYFDGTATSMLVLIGILTIFPLILFGLFQGRLREAPAATDGAATDPDQTA